MAGTEARAKAREAGTRACEAEPGRARVTFRRALRSEAVRMFWCLAVMQAASSVTAPPISVPTSDGSAGVKVSRTALRLQESNAESFLQEPTYSQAYH